VRIGVPPVSLASLKDFAARLRALPTTLAIKVAAAAAPALTEAQRATFNAGTDAFGGSWKVRDDGTRATLTKSGDLSKYVKYVAVGTRIRLALGVRYARYLIGTRPIAPKQGEGLPLAYQQALSKATADVIRAELGQ
jgi:hypothetical protein